MWSVNDCLDYLERQTPTVTAYREKFIEHEIDGKCLLKIDDDRLKMIKIDNKQHRDVILDTILKLRLKAHYEEFRSYEFHSMYFLHNLK